MHSLEEVRAEYDRLDRMLGIDTSGIELKVSGRAVRQLGSFRASSPLRITLSAMVMEDDALFMDTLRHEYAHAAVHILYPGERHGHDAIWKKLCRRIGCRPQSRTELTEKAAQLRSERVKYIVRCKGCGRESGYVRRGKVVELVMRGRGSRLRCACCGANKFELDITEKTGG